MGNLETTNSTKDFIKNGQQNPKGLIGAITIATIVTITALAKKAIELIGGGDKK